MRATFPENLKIRTEPGLRDAIAEAAAREFTTAAEWARRELRHALARRGAALPALAVNEDGPDDPAPFRPAQGARIAA